MKIEFVLQRLNEAQAFEVLRPFWEESMAQFPAGVPAFLDPGHLRETMIYAGIDPVEHKPVARIAKLVAADEALKRLACHCRRLLFTVADYPGNQVAAWPSLAHALGADADYFYFILALASVDAVRALHRQRGLPEDITQATCADIWRFRPCFADVRVQIPATLIWLRNATAGNLFKIGRHQYIRGPFKGPLRVYRHAASGDVIALAEGGLRFNAAGFFDGDGGIHDPRAWTTHLDTDEHSVRGFPVTPMGYALQREVRLRLNEWLLLLFRDTPVLDMHIPPAEPMPLEATSDSMRRALCFFARYLPERPFRAFVSHSWLFNTQLPDILGAQSNIAAWQGAQYLYPVPAVQPAGLPFIFSHAPFDLTTAPRDTRLRQGATALLERGDALRNGGMFGLPEDLPHFGERYYLSRWEGACQRMGLIP